MCIADSFPDRIGIKVLCICPCTKRIAANIAGISTCMYSGNKYIIGPTRGQYFNFDDILFISVFLCL